MPARRLQAELVEKAIRDSGAARLKLLDQTIQASRRAQGIYRLAFDRWVRESAGWAAAEVNVKDRLAIGLGGASVTEVGITLHHTYGTPVLPGSGLKGLASHYAAAVWGRKDPQYAAGEEAHKSMFGTTGDSGFLVFHDAWIRPDSLGANNCGVVLDVMTPHHPDYYMRDDQTAPTDFDDPTPIQFLTVRGIFRLVVECNGEGAEAGKWAQLGLKLLLEAVKYWGAGAKTSAGYGRMVEV